MTMFYIMMSSLFELMAIALLIWGYLHEEKVVVFEKEIIVRAKRNIRRLLRKSSRIVAWAEKPTKHGRPDEDFIAGQIKVHGDVWR